MLKSIDISGFPNLRIFELEYEYGCECGCGGRCWWGCGRGHEGRDGAETAECARGGARAVSEFE